VKQSHALLLAIALLACAAASAHAGPAPSDPPDYFGPATGGRAATNRTVTVAPSLAAVPNGRLWSTWYAGPTPGEDKNNYVVLATSGDAGRTWTETLVIDPDGTGPVRAFDPEVWLDPEGRLWLFWAQAGGGNKDAGTWAMVNGNPGAENPEWSAPRLLAPGVMMCKPIVLSDGTWAFPISDWEGRRLKTPRAATAGFWVSEDKGKTFSRRGAAHVPVEFREYDEHMLIERHDGTLWMLVRTNYGIGESISKDGGRTWTEVVPSQIPHTNSRFFISRLQSGNLLLLKHGSMDQRTGRSHLMAFISTDDGHSWEGGLLLDERAGISYPDGQQTGDGSIHVTYDFDRTGERQIFFATFREEDARAGAAVTDAVRLRQLVSKGSGGQPPEPKRKGQPRDNADGARLIKEPSGTFEPGGYEAAPFSIGERLFTDRAYTVAEDPDALDDAMFLRVPLEGEKQLVCRRPGMLFLLTPQLDRNKDSQAEQLEAKGFQKVAMAEIALFAPGNPRNWATLYQKEVVAGESVSFGQWAVPVFRP